MRVIAARPATWRGDSFKKVQFVSLATIGLALLDPGMARIALNQTEINCESVGINPAGFANDRGRWLMALALADLGKAETLFEAELAALDGHERSRPRVPRDRQRRKATGDSTRAPRFDDAGYLPGGLLASGELASTRISPVADARNRGSPLYVERLTGRGAGQFNQELLQVGQVDRLD